MATYFRRLLIRIGKVIPFVFAFVVTFGYMETIYAILNESMIVDTDGTYLYELRITFLIGNIVYIDWFDVFLLYILAVALEYCKYNFRAVHYLLLNLAIRMTLERLYLQDGALVLLCGFMALLGLYCVYGGFKMIPNQRGHF